MDLQRLCERTGKLNDVWGSGFYEPTYFLPEGSVPITSVASPSPPDASVDECPAARWHRRERERASRIRHRAVSSRGSNTLAEQRVQAAVEFLRSTRDTAMTRGTVNNVLATIHHLADTGNLVESTGTIHPSCVLPRDIRSLETRADGDVYLDFDTKLHMTSISQAESLLAPRTRSLSFLTSVAEGRGFENALLAIAISKKKKKSVTFLPFASPSLARLLRVASLLLPS